MDKKYEILQNESIEFEGRTLYRIRALKDFGDVHKGQIGGYVMSEDNLSHDGDCWIYNNAKCMDYARVCDNAKMYHNSCMYNYSVISDDSSMFDDSKMFGHSCMYDRSKIYNHSKMHDNTEMHNNSEMSDNGEMFGHSCICDYGMLFDDAKMYDSSIIRHRGKMFDDSEMHGNSRLEKDGRLGSDSILKDYMVLCGRLYSKCDKFYDFIEGDGCRCVTAVLKNGEILYNVGCQREITEDTFLYRIYNHNGGTDKNPYRKEYLKIIEASKILLR